MRQLGTIDTEDARTVCILPSPGVIHFHVINSRVIGQNGRAVSHLDPKSNPIEPLLLIRYGHIYK